MSELKDLKEQKRVAKSMMKMKRTTIGFLGSQYIYWENKHKAIVDKINEL